MTPCVRDSPKLTTGKRVIKRRAYSADRKAENRALEVEAGSLGELEETRRISVLRHEQRLGQAKQTGAEADLQHLAAK